MRKVKTGPPQSYIKTTAVQKTVQRCTRRKPSRVDQVKLKSDIVFWFLVGRDGKCLAFALNFRIVTSTFVFLPYPFIHFLPLIHFRVVAGLNSIPAVIPGYTSHTLDRPPICHRDNTERQPFMLTFTLRTPVILTCMCLDISGSRSAWTGCTQAQGEHGNATQHVTQHHCATSFRL